MARIQRFILALIFAFAITVTPPVQAGTTKKACSALKSAVLTCVMALGGCDGYVESPPTPLTISDTVPDARATAVAINSGIQITFNVQLDIATLPGAVTVTRIIGGTAVAGETLLSLDGRSLVFRPSAPLSAGTSYEVTVAGTVGSTEGAALGSTYRWMFSTTTSMDTTAPRIISITPGNIETSAGLYPRITVTFSEPMDASSLASESIRIERIATSRADLSVDPTITCEGAVCTLTPRNSLVPNNQYLINVMAGPTDLAGNALAEDFNSVFQTPSRDSTYLEPETASEIGRSRLAVNNSGEGLRVFLDGPYLMTQRSTRMNAGRQFGPLLSVPTASAPPGGTLSLPNKTFLSAQGTGVVVYYTTTPGETAVSMYASIQNNSSSNWRLPIFLGNVRNLDAVSNVQVGFSPQSDTVSFVWSDTRTTTVTLNSATYSVATSNWSEPPSRFSTVVGSPVNFFIYDTMDVGPTGELRFTVRESAPASTADSIVEYSRFPGSPWQRRVIANFGSTGLYTSNIRVHSGTHPITGDALVIFDHLPAATPGFPHLLSFERYNARTRTWTRHELVSDTSTFSRNQIIIDSIHPYENGFVVQMHGEPIAFTGGTVNTLRLAYYYDLTVAAANPTNPRAGWSPLYTLPVEMGAGEVPLAVNTPIVDWNGELTVYVMMPQPWGAPALVPYTANLGGTDFTPGAALAPQQRAYAPFVITASPDGQFYLEMAYPDAGSTPATGYVLERR